MRPSSSRSNTGYLARRHFSFSAVLSMAPFLDAALTARPPFGMSPAHSRSGLRCSTGFPVLLFALAAPMYSRIFSWRRCNFCFALRYSARFASLLSRS